MDKDKVKILDSFMSFAFKFLCVVVSAAVLLGAVFACSAVPARAADPVDVATAVFNFASAAYERAEDIAPIVQDAINEGGLSDLNKRKLMILALQDAAIKDITSGLFDPTVTGDTAVRGLIEFSLFEALDYDTFMQYYSADQDLIIDGFSQSGSVGCYYPSTGSEMYFCTVYPGCNFGQILVDAEHFQFTVDFDLASGTSVPYLISNWGVYNTAPTRGNYRIGSQFTVTAVPEDRASYYYMLTYTDHKSYLPNNIFTVNRQFSTSGSTYNFSLGYSNSSIPTLPRSNNLDTIYFGIVDNSVTLPAGTIYKDNPIQYYNDVLLPYLKNTFSDIDDRDTYIFFPDGYHPAQDPTEPETAPPVEIPESPVGTPVIVGTPTEVTEGLYIFAPTYNQITINGNAFIFGAAGAVGVAGAAGLAEGQVLINGKLFDLPIPDLSLDGVDVSLPDRYTINFGDFELTLSPDGTIHIEPDIDLTFPVGQPETNVDESFVYYYQLETFEPLYIPSVTLPSVDLRQFANSSGMLWDMVYDLLNGSGFYPLVVVSLSLGAIGYVIYKIGG